MVSNTREAGELFVAIDYFRQRYRLLKHWEDLGMITEQYKLDLAYVERKGKELKAQYDGLNVQPTLHDLAIDNEDELLKDLTLLIIDLTEAFNIGKGFSVPQIEQLGVSIMQRMGSLTLDDIALVFYRAKCGDYGTVYDRLDINVVNGWLNTYAKERQEALAYAAQNDHLGSKSGMSYDPADIHSVKRVSQDRGIDTDSESHYQAFKTELAIQKEAAQQRIQRNLEKSKK